jgi:hypothetical protein
MEISKKNFKLHPSGRNKHMASEPTSTMRVEEYDVILEEEIKKWR